MGAHVSCRLADPHEQVGANGPKCAHSYTRQRCECLCAEKAGFNIHVGAVNEHFHNDTKVLKSVWQTKAFSNMWADVDALPNWHYNAGVDADGNLKAPNAKTRSTTAPA